MVAAGTAALRRRSLTVDNGHDSLRAIRGSWSRCLLTLLGVSERLMAVGAGPWLMVVGIDGGAPSLAAAWVRTTRRRIWPTLVLLGTVPFADHARVRGRQG